MNHDHTPPFTARAGAAVVALVLFIDVCFQVYLAAGGTRGLSGAWGGQHDELPTGLRAASAASSLLLLGIIAIVLARAGFWRWAWDERWLRRATWLCAAFLGLSTLANAASESDWERYVNAPVALVLTLMIVVVAWTPPRRS